jgi:hypothetical protein
VLYLGLMLIGLLIAAQLDRANKSLRLLEPEMTGVNDMTAHALSNAIDRLYYRIHKKKFDQMRIDEQLHSGGPTPPEDSPS